MMFMNWGDAQEEGLSDKGFCQQRVQTAYTHIHTPHRQPNGQHFLPGASYLSILEIKVMVENGALKGMRGLYNGVTLKCRRVRTQGSRIAAANESLSVLLFGRDLHKDT